MVRSMAMVLPVAGGKDDGVSGDGATGGGMDDENNANGASGGGKDGDVNVDGDAGDGRDDGVSGDGAAGAGNDNTLVDADIELRLSALMDGQPVPLELDLFNEGFEKGHDNSRPLNKIGNGHSIQCLGSLPCVVPQPLL